MGAHYGSKGSQNILKCAGRFIAGYRYKFMSKHYKSGLFYLIILFAAFSCRKLEAPVYNSVDNIEIKDRSSNSVTISANVNFHNPNNYRITLKNADIDVLLNDKPITNFTKDYNLKIEKNENFTVPVEISFSMADLNTNVISSAINALLGKKQILSYRGNIKIKAYGIRINVPVNGNTDFDLNDL
jgi:LEA14-like dessication related protein